MYLPTQNDIRLLAQRNKTWLVKIEVLNKRFQVLATVQGEAISLSLKVDAASDVRRTCSLSMHVLNDAYTIAQNSYFWLDKMIRPWYGIYDAVHGEYVWYPMGVFLLDDNTYNFARATQTLSLSLCDLMGMTNDLRGSQIGAYQTKILVDSSIRNSMIQALTQLVGYDRYNVCEFPSGQAEVPYDLEFSSGVYPYEIIKKLRDLYPGYQTYFDVDGIFVCEAIPTHLDDPLTLDSSIMDRLIIDEQRAVDFSKVKNVTEIWGRELTADRTADSTVSDGNKYILTIPDYEAMEEGYTYGFTPDKASAEGQLAQINNLLSFPILVRRDLSDGTTVEEPLEAGRMKAGLPYVLYWSNHKFYFYGELNLHGVCFAVNNEPTAEQIAKYEAKYDCRNLKFVVNPLDVFAVERLGEITQVFRDGEYANIYTTELLLERAAYENWKSTRLQDTITLNMIIVPWLDVNRLVEYTSPMTGETMKAIVDSIDFKPTSGTMTVQLTKFYPYYPF